MSSPDELPTPQPKETPQDVSIPEDQPIVVTAADLPLYCPGPQAPLWRMHPRVYIEIAKTGKAVCPYCGARYEFHGDQKVHGH